MCLYPRLIQNKKYTKTKKNGGVIPAVFDKRVLAVPVGCGKCMECKKLKSREWQVRLLEEVRNNKKGIFITLTFSNESIKELYKDIHNLEGYELDNEIATKATRRFLERIRKETGKSVKHWLISELGHNGTENVHLHGIIWTENRELITKHWKYGYIWMSDKKTGYVNEQTINYITKYITKVDLEHKNYNPKILCSKGIGKGYLERPDAQNNKYKAGETKEYYKTRSGHKIGLPIYYRNKLYTEEEKEKLWLEKLDKEERYVGGEKVSVKNGDLTEYKKLLKYYQKKNKQYGYGDNSKNWDLIKYEKQRRILNYKKRLGQEETEINEIETEVIKPPKVYQWDELEKTFEVISEENKEIDF